MNKEDPYRDQAERLRKKIDRKQESEKGGQKSALPPRSRVHRERRKKNKWKIKYPVIRLLSLFFILLPITIFGIYNYLNKNTGMGIAEKAGAIEAGYETVGFAAKDKDKGTIIEVREENAGTESKEPETAPEKDAITDTPEPQSSRESEPEEKGAAIPKKPGEQPKAEEKPVLEKADEPKKQQAPKTEGKVVYHTVKPNETIFRIAMNYYKSKAGIEIIKKANNLRSNEIQVGQVLAIPLD